MGGTGKGTNPEQLFAADLGVDFDPRERLAAPLKLTPAAIQVRVVGESTTYSNVTEIVTFL